jgi:RNA polymerase-binding transcription factor DksA
MSGTLPSVPDQTLLSTLRGRLQAEVERLRGQIEVLEPGGALSYDENFADSGQVAAEQGENKALVNQFRKELLETQRALDKIDEGTYGVCERCGQAIAEARLEAMPATRYCIQHA